MPITCVILGLGYSAQAIARRLKADRYRVVGTTRTAEKRDALAAEGFEAVLFDGETVTADLASALGEATHLLCSAAPVLDAAGDPLLAAAAPHVSAQLEWLGYLSTIGVYGNRDGGWVDEETPPEPTARRTRRRVEVEACWLDFGAARGLPAAVFRLAGIYGPGRSPLEKIKAGTSRRVIKPGQVFNRIHVADIADAVAAAAEGRVGGIFNVADDEPAPPQEVIVYGSKLLGVDPPPAVAFDEADLSPMARSFYSDNKRIRNERMKALLGQELKYPNYRVGLSALAGR